MKPDSPPKHAFVCDACGVIHGSRSDVATIGSLRNDIANLERELRGKRVAMQRQRVTQNAAIQNDPLYDDAMRVLEYWRTTCFPGARELAGKRLENCMARLKGGYTVDSLKRSIEGYALKPFVGQGGKRSHEGHQDDWHADAELIFRNPCKVDAGIRVADRADDLRDVLSVRTSSPDATPTGSTLSELSKLGEAALAYAERGCLVFPCRAGEKVPATRNGVLDAKRDADTIRACWSANPDLNIGLATGRRSGIVVLDVDGDEGWDSLHRLEDRFEELPTTASTTTPRGGQHFYFQAPSEEIRNTAGFPGLGLDMRGDGGYVLATPSAVDGKPYSVDEQATPAPMPRWLLDLLLEHQRGQAQSIAQGRDWGAFISEGSSQGERDTRMCSYVGHMFVHGHEAGEVMEQAKVLNAAKVKPPLPDRDLARIVKSIAKAEARKS